MGSEDTFRGKVRLGPKGQGVRGKCQGCGLRAPQPPFAAEVAGQRRMGKIRIGTGSRRFGVRDPKPKTQPAEVAGQPAVCQGPTARGADLSAEARPKGSRSTWLRIPGAKASARQDARRSEILRTGGKSPTGSRRAGVGTRP